MILLELAQDLRINLKKTSNSKGGEYHGGPCPSCDDGIDRFVVWPQLNRYWCRRCGVKGDSIQFCRDFLAMTYQEACGKVKGFSHFSNQGEYNRLAKDSFPAVIEPPKEWQNRALTFVNWGQKQLKSHPQAMKELTQRGFFESTIQQFKLGYCINFSGLSKQDIYRERSDWGLPCEYKEDGRKRRIWLPTGLVIPTISRDNSAIIKLKVRRDQWKKEDLLPKYVEISGSMACPSIYGNTDLEIAIVLESELDAMLIQQAANDLCFCVALGGANKKPDFQADLLLKKAKLILWCLDNDDAGKNVAFWWRQVYSNLKFWPSPIGKSPGDALKNHGINLRDWIVTGIANYLQTRETIEVSYH